MKRRSFIGSILAAVATPVLAKVAPPTPAVTLITSDDNGLVWFIQSQNQNIDFNENESEVWVKPKVKQNCFSGVHGRGNMSSMYFVDESPFMPQT